MAARLGTPAAPPRRRPVTLRDFLELACDSSSDGFRSYPRRLPHHHAADNALLLPHLEQQQQQQQQAESLAPPPAEAAPQLLRRSPSRSSSSLSLSLFAFPTSGSGSGPSALASRISSLSRSFSRRIKEGFWRRRDEDDEEAEYCDDRDSCGFPSPLVSSCSDSSSEYAADESEADVTTTTSEETPASQRDNATTSSSPSSSSSSSAEHDRADDAAAVDGIKVQAAVGDADSAAVGRKKKLVGSTGMVEDKQQLSPVSVLDFPFDDDDDDGEEGSDAGTSSSLTFEFQRCTPPPVLHGTTQLLHKIRRYDGVAQGIIDPVDLDVRFTATTSESGESADADASSSTRPTTTTTTTSSSTDTSTSSTTPPPPPRHDVNDDDDEKAEEHQSAHHHSPLLDHHHHEEQEQDGPDPDVDCNEYRLLARLLEHDAAAAACLADDEVARVLVLDFFADGAAIASNDRRRRLPAGGGGGEKAEAALVGAAAEWLRGAGPRWGVGDVVLSGKAALDDMERGRRWICVAGEEEEEEREVGADVADALVDELVAELAVLPWLADRAVISTMGVVGA